MKGVATGLILAVVIAAGVFGGFYAYDKWGMK